MESKKREEGRHEGKKAERKRGEKIKIEGQKEECHLGREGGPYRIKWKKIDSSS